MTAVPSHVDEISGLGVGDTEEVGWRQSTVIEESPRGFRGVKGVSVSAERRVVLDAWMR